MFHAIQTYTPTVLVKEGIGQSSAFLITALIVVSIPGKLSEAYLVKEGIGRKGTIVLFGVISAMAAIVFPFAQAVGFILLCGMVLSFFGIGVDPAVKIYGAEQYPTVIRETGVGLIEGVGRLLGGALAPYFLSLVLDSHGVAGAYFLVAGVALVGVLAVAVLGRETRGQTLEKAVAVERMPVVAETSTALVS